jgi:hypothetical protein
MYKNALERLNRGHMIFLLLLMAQFQLWDGVITQVFVKGGLAREGNALVSNLVYGGDFLAVKIVSVAVLALALWLIFKRFPRLAITTTASIAIFYLGVITWNFLVVFSNTI